MTESNNPDGWRVTASPTGPLPPSTIRPHETFVLLASSVEDGPVPVDVVICRNSSLANAIVGEYYPDHPTRIVRRRLSVLGVSCYVWVLIVYQQRAVVP